MIKKLLKAIIPEKFIKKFWWYHWYITQLAVPNIRKGKIYFNLRFRITVKHPYYLSRGPLTYNEDGLATSHICGFLSDPKFTASYSLGERTGSFGSSVIRYRAYIACWCASQVKGLQGDFVECGVNKGGLSRTIINYIDFDSLGKTLYLLDTFNGLVEELISPEEKNQGIKSRDYEECYHEVQNTFKNHNVKIIRGTVPDTLVQVGSDKVCYLSIDMNCIYPEIKALDYFWDKLVPGAMVLLDDYGRTSFPEHKPTYDDYVQTKGKQILTLPTGQGLLIM